VFTQIVPNNRTGDMKKRIHPALEGRIRVANPNGQFA
jgi:hypothetical protein